MEPPFWKSAILVWTLVLVKRRGTGDARAYFSRAVALPRLIGAARHRQPKLQFRPATHSFLPRKRKRVRSIFSSKENTSDPFSPTCPSRGLSRSPGPRHPIPVSLPLPQVGCHGPLDPDTRRPDSDENRPLSKSIINLNRASRFSKRFSFSQ